MYGTECVTLDVLNVSHGKDVPYTSEDGLMTTQNFTIHGQQHWTQYCNHNGVDPRVDRQYGAIWYIGIEINNDHGRPVTFGLFTQPDIEIQDTTHGAMSKTGIIHYDIQFNVEEHHDASCNVNTLEDENITPAIKIAGSFEDAQDKNNIDIVHTDGYTSIVHELGDHQPLPNCRACGQKTSIKNVRGNIILERG